MGQKPMQSPLPTEQPTTEKEHKKGSVAMMRQIPTPDASIEALEKEFNKTIDTGYISSPTNDKYVVTQQNTRGKPTFPLILLAINLSVSESFKIKLLDLIKTVPPKGDEVSIVYTHENRAIFLCKSYGNKKLITIFKEFCVPFTYFVQKGKKLEDLSFDQFLDYDYINRDILQEDDDTLVEYTKKISEDKIASTDNSKYLEDIQRIIQSGKNTSQIDRLINPQKENSIPPTAQDFTENIQSFNSSVEVQKEEELPVLPPDDRSQEVVIQDEVQSFDNLEENR